MSSVVVLWVAPSPNPDPMNTCGLVRALESSRVLSRCQRMSNGRRKQTTTTWSSSVMRRRRRSSVVSSSLVVNPAGEMTLSSEEKVYNVVLSQAALVNEQLRSTSPVLDDVKKPQDTVRPGSLSLLGEAYDRCGEVCAEYAKTFYLGTLLMTPERRKAIWAIYVWCRRTDELVDGPNASHITPMALDRWEARLEDLYRGRAFDMLDAALADTVTRYPVDIQPFRDMIEGMRMDLRKSRYNNFDELYLYCYYVAGTVGLMSVPVMGIDPKSKATTESVYNAALALGIANQLTNILRDVGDVTRDGGQTSMNIASRIRRSFFREEKRKLPIVNGSSSRNEDDLLGVTDELIDHVRSFTIDTFKNFSLYDEEACVNPLEEDEEYNGVSSSENVKKDLSDWQERHAVLVLSKSKELSQLRFKLCPRLLKEDHFWKIYFKLVRNLVAKYELQAIQQAIITSMAMEASEIKGVYEVEMSETRPNLTSTGGPATP